MSSPLQYLRIGPDWSNIVRKENTPSFVANTSGTPIEFFLHNSLLTTINPDVMGIKTYIAGGSIGQICIDNQYLYARAINTASDNGSSGGSGESGAGGDDGTAGGEDGNNEDGFTTVVVGDKPVGDKDVEEQTAQIDRLLVEVMKITQRLNDTQARLSSRDFSYYKLLRYLVDRNNSTSMLIKNLSTRVVNLYTKVFAIENFIAKNKLQIFSMDQRLKAVEEEMKRVGFDGLAGKINEILLELGDINASLEIVMPLLEDAESIANSAITPIRMELSALNNTIATLAVVYDEDEVYAARDKLLMEYGEMAPETVPVIRNLAELVIEVGNKLDLSGEGDLMVLETKALADLDPVLPNHN